MDSDAASLLVDTGPLVAIYSKGDDHHELCADQLRELRSPLLTCWPVLTETCYLLRRRPDVVRKVLRDVRDGRLIRLLSLGDGFLEWVLRFFERYDDREPQLADAALVYLAEREDLRSVFTLDRSDFAVYRLDDGTALRVVPESGGG